MTKHENLLVTAMEECAEITQALSKSLRFGMKNYCDKANTVIDNNYNIMKKFIHLKVMIDMLIDEGVLEELDADSIDEISKNKKSNVLKYILKNQKEMD